MNYSRTLLRWQPPTKNEDGTDIDYELDYELGEQVGDTGHIVPVLTVVGSLQEGGVYVAPIQQMGFELGEHVLALRAINRDDPEKVSAWSNTIGLTVTADPTPAAPVLLA